MEHSMRLRVAGRFLVAALALALFSGVAFAGEEPEPEVRVDGFPTFITPADEYYVTRIGEIPEIDGESYSLEIGGLVDTPTSYTLDELYAMTDTELPLTVECIGNSKDGALLSTAVWKGVRLYDLLQSLGIDDSATGVRYEAADGYYASHTLDQLRENDVLLALYMNDEPMPPLHGFPVRVLNPGYYGVKQPAWVVSIEIIDRPLEDYWNDRGWDVSPPIAIDSKIFSPESNVTIAPGEPLRITGAAFGGTRVSKVEITTDKGETWQEARIVEQMDADNVWVFWEAELTFDSGGRYTVNARATDVQGNTQEEDDPDRFDGTNDWPLIRVVVR